MMTVKPSAARRSAMAAPMPRDAPVTIATGEFSGSSEILKENDEGNVNHALFIAANKPRFSGIIIPNYRTMRLDSFDGRPTGGHPRYSAP
ncbi:hypothetical protein [Serratia marcescens]|uniref:hypothetical protein n=1 Tax=Serratia marcescens TaxID=615 RepID=UPI00298EB2C5|nr:hypothetical protein [Serratia marcescens]WPC46120.1 hypothetical protein Q9K10_20155 [Serratia marcescens]